MIQQKKTMIFIEGAADYYMGGGQPSRSPSHQKL